MTDKEKELQAEAIDYYRKQIADLKKENAELKARVEKQNADILFLKHLTEELEKENAELKQKAEERWQKWFDEGSPETIPELLSDFATEATKELKEENEQLKLKLDEYKNIDKRLICNHKYFTSDIKNNNLAVICHSILDCNKCGRWEEE